MGNERPCFHCDEKFTRNPLSSSGVDADGRRNRRILTTSLESAIFHVAVSLYFTRLSYSTILQVRRHTCIQNPRICRTLRLLLRIYPHYFLMATQTFSHPESVCALQKDCKKSLEMSSPMMVSGKVALLFHKITERVIFSSRTISQCPEMMSR